MYHNNIDLILTFLGLFLIKNVFGAPGALNLFKNQTNTREAATRSIESIIDEMIQKMPSWHPTGELNFFCVFAWTLT